VTVVQFFPIFDRRLGLEIFEDLVTLLESLHDFDVGGSGLDVVQSLLKHDLSASSLFKLLLEELLLLKGNQSSVLLAFLEKGLNLSGRFLLLILQLFDVSTDLSLTGFNVKDSLIVGVDSVFACS